jgi:Spy/CpxP family protein refolding chaperone
LFRPSAKEIVMKTLIAVVGLVVGASAYAAQPAVADEKADQGGVLAHRVQALHLTDEQETKITDIRKDFRPRVQAATRELAALVKEEEEKIRAVLTPEQKTKLAAAKLDLEESRAERQAEFMAHMEELDLTDAEMVKIARIRKDYRARIVRAVVDMEKMLTEEQKKVRDDGVKAGKSRQQIAAALKLTDEQKLKVEGVSKVVRALMHDELEKMRNVLTEGQKEKLEEFRDERRDHVRDRRAHRIANLDELKLTDEQKTQIADIRKEFRPKIHDAGNKLRATVRQEADAVLAVLTK